MDKQQIIESFDPNQPGSPDATIFGLPFSAEQSEIIIIPVPWEVTVSYGSGASKGPDAILEASFQVDLLHQDFPDLWKLGIFLEEPSKELVSNAKKYKELAQPIIQALEKGESTTENPNLSQDLEEVNYACANMVETVEQQALYWLNRGKKVVLLGGDHSTPLGYYQALANKYESFGILHIDAHMDLRIAYEGFTYSHASIMYNALQLPQISKIVQVGIRDFCDQEVAVVNKENGRVLVHTDTDLKKQLFEGNTWQHLCDTIINSLPRKVCISLDIDGLNALYCQNTGTPVPGGLSYEQLIYLLNRFTDSGKEIIGFDLVEVAPGENDWDGNVGARLLYHLCGVLAKSQKMEVGKKIEFKK